MINWYQNSTSIIIFGIVAVVAFGLIVNTSAEEQYTLVRKWGSEGSADGQFQSPHGLAVDRSNSNVYVTQISGDSRVQKFTSTGNFILKWGSQCDIVPGTGCIDPDGPDGPLSKGDGQFMYPRGIAVDASKGDVYVSDAQNRRVQKFTSTGNFIIKWGSPGTGDGQFNGPHGVAVDPSNGDVYVVENGGNRVQKFTSDGQFITKWGSEGPGNGEFHFPQGIAVGSNGDVYVVDTFNHRIEKFTQDGDFITKWGSQGSLDGQLDFPADIAVDASDNVYVGDKNRRVQKFTSDGEFVTKWGSFCNLGTGSGCVDPDGQEGPLSSGDGQFYFPQGIALDRSGSVYVADIFNNRIEVFGLLTDTTPPDTTITSTIDGNSKVVINGGSSSSNLITFNFDGTDNGGIQGFKCILDQNSVESCTSPKTYSNLDDGKHNFSVLAIDTSSNEDPTPATLDWRVDSTKPTVTASPVAGTYHSDLSITLTASEDAIIYYTTDGSDPTISSQHGPSPLSGINISNEGQTLLKFFAVDLSGNIGNDQTEIYTIDKTAPVVTVPSSDLVVQATSSTGVVVTFSATAHDNIDGEIAATCTPASGTIFPVGNTIVNCSATDKAGNTGIASFNIIVKEPPKPAAEHTSLSLVIKPNRAVAIGQDYSLSGRLSDGTIGRKLVGGQDISFTTEPSGIISVPTVKTDVSGKFGLSKLKAPDKDGTYKIVAHFAGSPFLLPSESNPVILKVERHATSLSLQIKGNPISGSSLSGDLIDFTTHKGISSQVISFTTNKPDLVVHDIITDSKGKYKISLPPFECGTTSIQMQSHFDGTDVFKPSDSKVSVLRIPRCLSSQQLPSSSFEVHTLTNNSKDTNP